MEVIQQELKPDERKPEIPWDQWLEKTQKRLSKIRTSPEEKGVLYYDIPFDDQDWERIIRLNQEIRSRVSKQDAVFYRPGIGWGGALPEMLQKAGAFSTMIVADPVYREKDMVTWSEGVLPIDYYLQTLNSLEAKDIKIEIETPDHQSTPISTDQATSAQIPANGQARFEYTLNGLHHKLILTDADMTKDDPGQYDILGIGRPTPFNNETTQDPRSIEFIQKAMMALRKDGVVHYDEQNFRFLPHLLPESAFGFKTIYKKDTIGSGREVIIQKIEDKGESLSEAIEAEGMVREAVFALSGSLQYPQADFVWLVNVTELNQMRHEEPPLSYEDVIDSFKENIKHLDDFSHSLSADIKKSSYPKTKIPNTRSDLHQSPGGH